MDALERKMRRRIRRQMKTGVKQPRVRKLDENIYAYIVKHHPSNVDSLAITVVKLRVRKTNGSCRLVKI